MMGAAVFTYGMLTSFVLQGASRNAKLRRPNPRVLEMTGYVLCGMSGAGAVALLGYAAQGLAA